MVSQWRYALSLHSSMNSGSFFFEDIRRMTSSLKPGATESVSISVTNPYLYSWFAIDSSVCSGVLIEFLLCPIVLCPTVGVQPCSLLVPVPHLSNGILFNLYKKVKIEVKKRADPAER